MSRWHEKYCQSPDVYITDGSAPRCRGCGGSAATVLQGVEQGASSSFPAPPLDEPYGKMNLTWPSAVRYVRVQPDGKTVEVERPSRQDEGQAIQPVTTSIVPKHGKSEPQITTQMSPIYGRALAPDEFRSICLSAVQNESTSHLLHMNLEVHQDDNCPDYEAISYTWGGEDNESSLCQPIYIGEYWDILLQTKNCWAMLRYLRPTRGIRLIWVDAICINQNDTVERGSQVAKMGQIYSQCSQVVVWLGSDLVLQKAGVYPRRYRLSELGHSVSPRLPSQDEGQGSPQHILDITSLLERRYFSRVWVIQELILAPRIILPIGNMIFWADAATLKYRERGTDLSLQRTTAPWFEHLARGSLQVAGLPELMALTSKSQATDDRDRLFGVLGLYKKKEGEFALRPDYSLSLQHVSVGFFAHCIINQQKFQLLSKATGVTQGRSSLTWMPEWKSRNSWEEIFLNFHEVYEQPEVDSVRLTAEALLNKYSSNVIGLLSQDYTLVYFTRERLFSRPIQEGTERNSYFYKETVHNKRPWNRSVFVDADTGALGLDLVRLCSIIDRPRLVSKLGVSQSRGLPLSLYGFQPKAISQGTSPYHFIASALELDKVIKQNDEVFILHPAPLQTLVYLVLRPTSDEHYFKLVAYCSFLFLGTNYGENTMEYLKNTHTVGLGLLHGTVAEDIDVISTELDVLLKDLLSSPSTAHPFRLLADNESIKDNTLWSLLPLFIASMGTIKTSRLEDIENHYSKTLRSYLNLIDQRWRPQILGSFFHITFNSIIWQEIWDASQSEFLSDAVVWEYLSTWKTWKKLERSNARINSSSAPGIPFIANQAHEVTIRCNIDQLHNRIQFLAPRPLLDLYKAGLLGVSDSDVEARLRAGPVEEDFHTRSPFRDEDLQQFLARNGIDGRACQVHIV